MTDKPIQLSIHKAILLKIHKGMVFCVFATPLSKNLISKLHPFMIPPSAFVIHRGGGGGKGDTPTYTPPRFSTTNNEVLLCLSLQWVTGSTAGSLSSFLAGSLVE